MGQEQTANAAQRSASYTGWRPRMNVISEVTRPYKEQAERDRIATERANVVATRQANQNRLRSGYQTQLNASRQGNAGVPSTTGTIKTQNFS